MKISGFSFARNADSLYYPVVESITSILPLCDEFIIAVGRGSDGDRTRERIQAIGDPKIRIVDTIWKDDDGHPGHIFRRQTDIALDACRGDWCFYLQSDEVVHEKHLPAIRTRCGELLDDASVQGLLFSYRHFWGDYDHYHINHKWYPREIRVVRNNIGVRSWCDAQSFRINEKKLRVAPARAEIFHYGWVRPPALMQNKNKEMERAYHGDGATEKMFEGRAPLFDYGPLNKLALFRESHPATMRERIARMDWKKHLDYAGLSPARFKHDRLKYRILTFLEQKLLGGKQIGGFKNYTLLRNR